MRRLRRDGGGEGPPGEGQLVERRIHRDDSLPSRAVDGVEGDDVGRWAPVRPQEADLLLLGVVLAAGLGYAEGGKLSRDLGGWQVICWALLLAAPLLVVPVGLSIARHGLSAGLGAWLGFAYVAVVSMFLGFFAWYRGLALGGMPVLARCSSCSRC